MTWIRRTLNPQPQQNSILQRKEVPDGLLVGQALEGDQSAFELLVTRYQQRLVNHIQGFLKDHDQSYEILQQVYLQLYLSLPILLTNGSLKGWLFQIVRNRCLFGVPTDEKTSPKWIYRGYSNSPPSPMAVPCTGYMEYPFENKQGKSCLLNLSCEVDKEEIIEVVIIINAFLERIFQVE